MRAFLRTSVAVVFLVNLPPVWGESPLGQIHSLKARLEEVRRVQEDLLPLLEMIETRLDAHEKGREKADAALVRLAEQVTALEQRIAVEGRQTETLRRETAQIQRELRQARAALSTKRSSTPGGQFSVSSTASRRLPSAAPHWDEYWRQLKAVSQAQLAVNRRARGLD